MVRLPVKRKRPRLCATCLTDATWASVEDLPITSIKRDGTVRRSVAPRSTYYCNEHVGAANGAGLTLLEVRKQ